MDLLVEVVAVVGLTGIAAMSVLAPAIGVVMPLLLLIGLVDGPTGGRLGGSTGAAARVTGTDPEASPARSHRPAA